MNESSPLLLDKQKSLFHTNVATLFYLSRQATLGIITVVGFLCTRVQKLTIQGNENLILLLGYLRRMQF